MKRKQLVEDRTGERARIYGREKAILVGLDLGKGASWEERESMEELIALSETAGVEVLNTIVQKRSRPDASYFIGEGKAEKLREMAEESRVDAIIFNDALSPAQNRNLEERIGRKIIDRAQLIMDIFAQRAQTKEARLQVELAQLEYLLPRLRGWGRALERLGGGIGTRGPGETRLESERQKVQQRVHRIKERLKKVERERQVKGKRRKRRGLPTVALIGYTNTGKSTLLNKLSNADSKVEDKLFATLDSLVRRTILPSNREVLLIDTVGFIKKLPHQLIPAFSATLESTKEADLLLNILDVSHESIFDHWRTVTEILNDIFKGDRRPKMINVLNKIDRLCTEEDHRRLERAKHEINNCVEISALEGVNLEGLRERIAQELSATYDDRVERLLLEIPYSQAGLIDEIHRLGEVYKEEYRSEKVILEASLERSFILALEKRSYRDGLKLKYF